MPTSLPPSVMTGTWLKRLRTISPATCVVWAGWVGAGSVRFESGGFGAGRGGAGSGRGGVEAGAARGLAGVGRRGRGYDH